MTYKLTHVSGKYFLYNMEFSQKVPWFRAPNAKVLMEYISFARISKRKIEGIEKVVPRRRLYRRMRRDIQIEPKILY